MVSGTGQVYRVSESLSMTQAGQFPFFRSMQWAANSSANKMTAVITDGQTYPDTEVTLVGDEYYNYIGKIPLPAVYDQLARPQATKARQVFWNLTADRLITVGEADIIGGFYARGVVHVLTAGPCQSLTLGTGSAAFSKDGGPGDLQVNAPSDCVWKAASSAPWLTIASGGWGVGPSSLVYKLAPNATSASRSGTISVSGATHTVTQSAASVSLSATAQYFQPAGGTGSVTVTTMGAGAAWLAYPSVPWISIAGNASGTGNGSVSYAVEPNPHYTTRTGLLTIGGVSVTVTQGAYTEIVFLSTNYIRVAAQGGTVTFSFTTRLAWVAGSEADWLHIVSPASATGFGNGTVTVRIDPNPRTAERYDDVLVNGQVVTISQEAGPPTLTFDPASISANAAGASGS